MRQIFNIIIQNIVLNYDIKFFQNFDIIFIIGVSDLKLEILNIFVVFFDTIFEKMIYGSCRWSWEDFLIQDKKKVDAEWLENAVLKHNKFYSIYSCLG